MNKSSMFLLYSITYTFNILVDLYLFSLHLSQSHVLHHLNSIFLRLFGRHLYPIFSRLFNTYLSCNSYLIILTRA